MPDPYVGNHPPTLTRQMEEIMENIIRQYTSAEALAVAQRTPPVDAASRRPKDHRRGWAGDDFETAVEKARYGDHRSALKIRDKLGTFAGIRGAQRATQRWDVAGSSVDMGRFMAGEPENMIDTRRARRSVPVMKLAIERAVPYTTPTSTMVSTGASVLAAVEGLRTAGVPAEIWVTYSVRPRAFGHIAQSSGYSLQILIQEAGRPINMDVLAFWTVNPSSFRRIAFAIYEQEDKQIVKDYGFNGGGGYGSPSSVTNAEDYDEVAPANEYAVTSWLQEVLVRRAGVTVKGRI